MGAARKCHLRLRVPNSEFRIPNLRTLDPNYSTNQTAQMDFPALAAVLIVPLVKIALLVGGLMTAAAYLVLLERLIAAWVQDRLGPNRVGPFGLLQPLADGLKFIFKEEYTPAHVDKFLFILAPVTILAAALAIFAVIPFGSVLPPLDIPGVKDPIQLVVGRRCR